MKIQGIVPLHQILDKETSQAYKDKIRNTGMTYQLVPPDNRRHNISEKSIQTWKNHFVRVLSGSASTFPLHLWCQAIPQAEQQLLLLSQSNVNSNISSYSHVYDHHNYNAAPFVLIGMESLVHDKPHRRNSFAEYCRKGYALGTLFKHYRGCKIWMQQTRATQVSATVVHRHKYILNPAVTPADSVISAARNLVSALKRKMPQYLQ